MELDFVDARSEAVVCTKARTVLVRLEPPGHHLRAGGSLRKGAHLGLGPASPFPAQPIQQREVACQRVVALQGRRLVQDLVRGHEPTLSHVEWPGSAEVLEQPQLPLAKTAHAQTQLRLAQQIRQRRQRAVFHVAGAEVEHDAVAVFVQDPFQQLPGVVKVQLAVDLELAATLVLEAVDAHAKSLWIRRAGRKLRRMRWFGRKSARPVVPGRMPRLPPVPKGVRIGAWCAAALFGLIAAGVGIIAINCPPDRARIHEAADSRDVLEPDLSRERLLRRRGSLAWLLRAYGARAVRFPGGAPRRASQGAFQLRSPPLPRAGIEAAQPRPRADAQAEGDLAQG